MVHVLRQLHEGYRGTVVVELQGVGVGYQLILHAMQEEDGAPGVLDSVNVPESLIDKWGDHEAEPPEEAP